MPTIGALHILIELYNVIPGALLMHFNLTTAILLNNVGVLAGIGSATWPLLKAPKDKHQVITEGTDKQE